MKQTEHSRSHPRRRVRVLALAGLLLALMILPALAAQLDDNSDSPTAGEADGADLEQISALILQPGSLTVYGIAGGPDPPPQEISIDAGEVPVQWSAAALDSWLAVSPSSGGTPGTVTVTIDTSGLDAGSYQSAIEFLPGGEQLAVSLELQGGAAPSIGAWPASLEFTSYLTEGAPAAQNIWVEELNGGEAGWYAVSSAAWIGLSHYSGTTPDAISVQPDTSGLEAGQYNGTVWVSGTAIPVTMEVLDEAPPVEPEPTPTPITPPPEPTAVASPTPSPTPTSEPTATPSPTPEPSPTPTPSPTPLPEPEVVIDPKLLGLSGLEGSTDVPAAMLEIGSSDGSTLPWEATASEPWLHLSVSSGETPATVDVTASLADLPAGTHSANITVGDLTIPVTLEVRGLDQAVPEFEDVWARQDLPVQEGVAARTWLWGPGPLTTIWEPFAEAPGGHRLVQYYDKSRMEVTYPDANPSDAWYVTNGRLAAEMITGSIQTGEGQYEQHSPANIPVAGDADDPNGPRYSSFMNHLDEEPIITGNYITQTIDAAGNLGENPALANYEVFTTEPDPTTGHSIASVFWWDYLYIWGTVWNGEGYTQGRLFEPRFYATGLPITEAYWSRVKVNGIELDVLVQCFERRCLTYSPTHEPAWRIEQGNVGRHYYQWRYGSAPETPSN